MSMQMACLFCSRFTAGALKIKEIMQLKRGIVPYFAISVLSYNEVLPALRDVGASKTK